MGRRQSFRAYTRRLLLAYIGSFGVAFAQTGLPPVPAYSELPLPMDQPVAMDADGTLRWLDGRPISPAPAGLPPKCWAWELVARQWQPATGAVGERALELGGQVVGQIALPHGILSVSTVGCQRGAQSDRLRLGLLTRQGRHITVETEEKIGQMRFRFLPRGDDSAVIVTRTKDERFIVAFVVRRDGDTLAIERMPVLPIPYRGDFAAAIAGGATPPAGSLMILGGSDAQYRGCSPCRAETHVLDIATRRWSAGPPMVEARSELDATRLPDGSVLVTGGWTRDADWGHGPARTAERWDPVRNRFDSVAPMPSGTARHRGVWLPREEGRVLTLVEGVNGAAQAYDVAAGTWRTAGAWVQGSEEGGCGFMPFRVDGNAYAWLLNRAEGHYSSKSCMEQKYATLSLLRPPYGSPPSAVPPPESLLVTYRSGAAFLPASGSEPALIIAGSTHGGMNAYLNTTTVEAVGRDGRMWSLPTLRVPRRDARVFRIGGEGGGVLVVGGVGGEGGRGGVADDRAAQSRPLPMEWLASLAPGQAHRFDEVAGAGIAATSALAQTAEGDLIEVADDGAVTRWQLRVSAGKLALERSAMPSLNRARRSQDRERVQVRALRDGRIVVAGGVVQAEKIALLGAGTDRPDAVDEYVGIGDFLPSRRHEIFDPMAKRWITSAAATGAGGNVAILDDGRVRKRVMRPDAKPLLEISAANGMAWRPMRDDAGSRLKRSDLYREFSVDGELFASGELEHVDTGGGPSGVEWFDSAASRWELLWQAGARDNWRDHVGRILVRPLGNGKSVVLPVDGF